MKKQLIATALTVFSFSATDALAQANIDPNNPFNYTDYNKLKYGSDLIAVGNINVSISEKVKAKPDTVEFSIRYLTEDASPTEASNKNTASMKALTTYLEKLGIKPKDLTTISYKTYEQITQKPSTKAQDKLHKTTITVNAVIDAESFYDVIALLEKNNISNLEKVRPADSFYTFTIVEKATDAKAAKQLAQDKFKKLSDALKAKNVTEVTIEKYQNEQTEGKQQEVKNYFVENTLKIRTHDFDNLSKIITKAQELKMSINNDMTYTVSEDTRNQLIAKAQSQLLTKLIQKATLLLGNNNYQLGAVQNLQSFEDQPIIQPRHYRNDIVPMAMNKVAMSESLDIQVPDDFDINITLSGNFDILKPVHK